MCRSPRHADPYRHRGPSRAGLAAWLFGGLLIVLAGAAAVSLTWWPR
jgi:hypothetical protein